MREKRKLRAKRKLRNANAAQRKRRQFFERIRKRSANANDFEARKRSPNATSFCQKFTSLAQTLIKPETDLSFDPHTDHIRGADQNCKKSKFWSESWFPLGQNFDDFGSEN